MTPTCTVSCSVSEPPPSDSHLLRTKKRYVALRETRPIRECKRSTTTRTEPISRRKTKYVEMTWDQLKNLPKDRVNDFQGAAISVVGFLSHQVKVEKGSGESTNCHLTGDNEVDWHIYLTNLAAQPISQAIIVETTPRVRPLHKWSKSTLDPLVDSSTQVRISGWLMYDFEHENVIGTQRASVLEIHPITRSQIMNNGQWSHFDNPY